MSWMCNLSNIPSSSHLFVVLHLHRSALIFLFKLVSLVITSRATRRSAVLFECENASALIWSIFSLHVVTKRKKGKKKKKHRCAGDKHSHFLSFRYFCLFVCLNHMGLEKNPTGCGARGRWGRGAGNGEKRRWQVGVREGVFIYLYSVFISLFNTRSLCHFFMCFSRVLYTLKGILQISHL